MTNRAHDKQRRKKGAPRPTPARRSAAKKAAKHAARASASALARDLYGAARALIPEAVEQAHRGKSALFGHLVNLLKPRNHSLQIHT